MVKNICGLLIYFQSNSLTNPFLFLSLQDVVTLKDTKAMDKVLCFITREKFGSYVEWSTYEMDTLVHKEYISDLT